MGVIVKFHSYIWQIQIWENLLMKKILSALLMFAVLGTALADPVDEAWDAYGRDDYAKGLKITRPLAASGVAWAQFLLGDSFASGLGVKQNYAEAVKWFRLAAAQGYAFAQLSWARVWLSAKAWCRTTQRQSSGSG